MVITEALAELKTIKARIAKKREAIGRYLARDSKMRDPLEKEGGSAEFVRRELQAIGDLQTRILAIREGISSTNRVSTLTIQGETRTISAWLTWKREIAPEQKGGLQSIVNAFTSMRAQYGARGYTVSSENETGVQNEIVVAVREADLAAEVEKLETILGELDGKLSLANATLGLSI